MLSGEVPRHRILRDEFQKCRIPKIVSAIEGDALIDQLRMLIEVGTQPGHVPSIDEVHGASKCGVFNSLMMSEMQLIGESWLFNMRLQSRPSSEIHTRERL